MRAKRTALGTAKYVLEGILKLLHPFMPFITEEIYSKLTDGKRIITADWPAENPELADDRSVEEMQRIMEMVREIRNARAEMNVPPSKKAKVIFEAEESRLSSLASASGYFKTLAGASEIERASETSELKDAVSIVVEGVKIYLPLSELIDFDKELERLSKDKSRFESEIKRAEGKLANPGFTAKAPPELIKEEQTKIDKYKEMLEAVEQRIAQLKR